MAEKKRPRRTRERIVETSLRLFNESGEPHVTTALIAAEMGISPGNLYYHFRSKDEIVRELFARFERRLLQTMAVPEDRAADVEDVWLLLHLLFEVMWEYRFLYRDLEDLLSRDWRMAAHFGRLIDRATGTVVSLSESLVASGSMRATRAEIEALAGNVLLVMTYWMSFQRLRQLGGRESPAAKLDHAAYQVLSLVAPYLVGEARELLERLRREYLD